MDGAARLGQFARSQSRQFTPIPTARISRSPRT
jgi:hypothetical protein